MADLNIAVKIAGADAGASGVIGSIVSALEGITGAAGRAGRGAAGLGASLAGIGIGIFGLKQVASAVGSVAVGMVSGNAEMETYQTQLGTLLGSADAAKDRLAELAKFGAETPFDLPEVVRAEKVLVGFGLTGQHVFGLTGKTATEFRTVVGDVAAGTGAQFEDIALSFGKFSAGATGEAIERFQELGVATREQMAALGVQFSKSGELLSPLPVAMQAVVQIAQSKFGGGMDKLSKTFAGQMSTLSDNLNQAKNTLTQPIFDVLRDSVGGLNDVLSGAGFQGALQSVATTLGGVVARGVDVARTAFSLLMDIVHDRGDLGAFADSIRELFGVDITPIVNLQRWIGERLPGALATLRTAVVQTFERVTTFFGGLVEGATLATTVNRAFGDLIPPGLNSVLDAVDNAILGLKQTFLGLVEVFANDAEWSEPLEQGLTLLFGPGGTTDAAITSIFAFQQAWQNTREIAADVAAAYGQGGLATAFEQLTASLQKAGAAETAGAMTAALTQNQTALGNLLVAIGTVGDALGWLVGRFNSGADSAGGWGRVIDNVFGGIVRGVTAPIAGFNALTGAFQHFVDTEVETGALAIASQVHMADFLVSSLGAIVAATGAAWTQVTTAVTMAGEAVLGAVTSSWQAITGAVQSATSTVLALVSGAWNAVMNVTDERGVTLRDAINTNWRAIVGYTQVAWQTVRDTVASWLGSAESVVRSALDSVSSYVSQKWGEATSATSRAWESIASTVSGALNSSIVPVVRSAWDTVSSVTSSMGSAIQSSVSSTWSAVTSSINSALESAKSVVSSALGAIGSLLTGSGVASSAETFGSQIVNGITGALGSLGQGLRDAVAAAIRSIDVTVGMFHITAGGVSVSWPTIKPPTISATSNVSAYAAGTDYARGGMALVGERGPELMYVPSGAGITPNSGLAAVVDKLDAAAEKLAAAADGRGGNTYQLTYTGGTSNEATPRDLERTMQRMAAFA